MAAQDGASPKEFSQTNFTEHIEVLVGAKKQSFMVYRDIICSRSTFFKAAYSKRWNQTSKAIELPEDAPAIFNAYLCCLYKNKTMSSGLPHDDDDDADAEKENAIRTSLLPTYVLADKLGDVGTANLIMDEIADYLYDLPYPHLALLKRVLELTSSSSLVQQLFVDNYSIRMNADKMKELRSNEAVPRDFVCRVLIEKTKWGMRDYYNQLDPTFGLDYLCERMCRYRLHDEEHPCCGHHCKQSKCPCGRHSDDHEHKDYDGDGDAGNEEDSTEETDEEMIEG